ncbi:MAG: glycoside hydrolase/phage tail family protein [Pseudomonadota bacterium]
MAQIVLAEAGARLGAQLLPQGLNLLGAQIAGQAIGRTIGSVAGAAVDGALFGRSVEGPRLKSLHVMESREGAPIANVYGRMRVGGQVIWAARFKETRTERSAGGKGGPTTSEYSYTVSFAVGICEGELTRIDRVWANGAPLALSNYAHRFYRGTEDQVPDGLIDAIEGAGNTPAYRGLAYLVFEDFPLDPFGNRIPQLSFEVTRVPPSADDGDGLRTLVEGVNIIPASGEFVYASDIVRTRRFAGIETPINMNNAQGIADFTVSLDQLESDLPGVRTAALTVGWFGDDLRAGDCKVRPGVEQRDKSTVPWAWKVCGTGRAGAHLISRTDDAANYGGTPADQAVIQGIRALVARGMAVTLSPFLFMDVPPGNGLADPYGKPEQAAFPWRGRITTSGDGTSAAGDEVSSFLGSAGPGDFSLDGERVVWTGDTDDWGFRRFILHHAMLAKAAGGVEAFLIGSEMVALTRKRDELGNFPFVDGLRSLAADVRSILGPGVKVSYAADWTEYGAQQIGGDVMFPLDALWADANVDFVGIDWYPPMGDWRTGPDHLDTLAGYGGPDDPAYLFAQIEGGEAFDWYYASDADRAGQVRTPISDTAHGEDWVFRAKDIKGWWDASHHERPGGVRALVPTPWTPGMKPVRLSEIGFPAVDRGTNSPNLFYDPKSDESALPPFSTGERDDVIQRRALETVLTHFRDVPFVEEALVWSWDGRPWPDFPVRDEVWSDGANWSFGHWLNGRVGFAPFGDVVADICRRGGVTDVDASALSAGISGFVLDGVHSVRGALEPLRMAFAIEAVERDGALVFGPLGQTANASISRSQTANDGPRRTRGLLDKSPGRVRIAFADIGNDYQTGSTDARDDERDTRLSVDVSLPVGMTASSAATVAARLLMEISDADRLVVETGLSHTALEPGDIVEVEGQGGLWRISDISDGRSRVLDLEKVSGGAAPLRYVEPVPAGPPAPVFPAPELIIIDAPRLPGAGDDFRPLVAVSADPWAGVTTVFAGEGPASLTARVSVPAPASVGVLVAPLSPGFVGRWDEGSELIVDLPGDALSSISAGGALSGGNAAFVETTTGWELLTFRTAELQPDGAYRLSGLLRGLQGSDEPAAAGAEAGAVFVLLTDALVRADVSEFEQSLALNWRAGSAGDAQLATWDAIAGRPWPVVHLRTSPVQAETRTLSWFRRGPDIPDGWDQPDPLTVSRFEVQVLDADGYGPGALVETTSADVPATTMGARVAAIGDDGRRGPWVSISWESL